MHSVLKSLDPPEKKQMLRITDACINKNKYIYIYILVDWSTIEIYILENSRTLFAFRLQ